VPRTCNRGLQQGSGPVCCNRGQVPFVAVQQGSGPVCCSGVPSLSWTCPNPTDPFIRWSYDKVGNRLTEQTTTYSYDFRDRLLSAGSTSYTYDQDGNELSAGSRTFTYDLANRLKTTTQGTTTTTYSYDGDGVRLQASTGTQANKKTNFLWDVNDGLPQVALERDGNNALLRRYVYGVRRISMTSGSNTSYYIPDGLGSASNLTSSSGATQWTWSYEPFGAIRTETKAPGSQPTNFLKFTGEYLDPTGLYHLRARQYDPASERFLRPDPVDPGAGSAFIAGYVYAADRPTVLVDPSGELFQASTASLDAVDVPMSPVDTLAFPFPVIGDGGGGCAARPGYPLGIEGEWNSGPATHKAKHGHGEKGHEHHWYNENAVDINVPYGTPVCAIFDGAISPGTFKFGPSSEGFRFYLVGRNDIAFYQHLSERLSGRIVRKRQKVKRGQLLGFSGCGTEGVPHLHLALLRGDPERYTPHPRPKAVSGRPCA